MTRPTLNYRSKTEAVMALKAQGLRVDAIARRIGTTVKNVETMARYARRRGLPLPVEVVETLLSHDVHQRLVPQARKRKVTVDRLIVQLITAIANDNMVDAVLDDKGAA